MAAASLLTAVTVDFADGAGKYSAVCMSAKQTELMLQAEPRRCMVSDDDLQVAKLSVLTGKAMTAAPERPAGTM